MTNKKEVKQTRTPVVTVMGHVDHGKTTLLDFIRKSRVAQGEVGGITQKIRVHGVEYKGQKITFVDTPGHEAFTALREKGAKVTDIVLLVVAADDGVKAQTKEAIKYAKKGNIPIIVAINKMDIPGIAVSKIKQELASADVLLEDWGGDVLFTEISALKGTNVDKLMDNILLQAELSELRPGKLPRKSASVCMVLETSTDKSIGNTITAIVKAGELQKNQYVQVSTNEIAKIRSILDEYGKKKEIGLVGDPVIITGVQAKVTLGEELVCYKDQGDIHAKIKKEKKSASEDVLEDTEIDLESLFMERMVLDEKETAKKIIPIILKADTLGSIEAIKQELGKLSDDEVGVNIIEVDTGQITESDIYKAKTQKAVLLGFNAQIPFKVQEIANREKVILKNYSIIYELIDDIDLVLDSLLMPTEEEIVMGKADVKKVFILSKGQVVAGCMVIEGSIRKGYKVYVERNGERIGTGTIRSLRTRKDEITESPKGTECGIIAEPQIGVEEGDIIVCYKVNKLS